MKPLRRLLKSQKGVASIYVLMTLAVLFPMMIYVTIEFPYLTNNHRRLKNNLDNAGSSAILCLNESELSQGRLTLDEICVRSTVYQILAANYKLNPLTLQPLDGSPLVQAPTIHIRTINNPSTLELIRMPEQSMSEDEKFQDVYVDQTSVVIYVEMKFHAIVFNSYKPVIRHVSSSQSTFGVS